MVENVKVSVDVEMLSNPIGNLSQDPLESQNQQAGYVKEYPQAVLDTNPVEPVDGTLAPLNTQTMFKTKDRSVVQARQQTSTSTTLTQKPQTPQATKIQTTPTYGDDE